MQTRARKLEAAALAALLAIPALGCERAAPAPAQAAALPAPAASPEPEGIPGRWRKLRPERLDPALSPEQRDLVARLEALGYAQGSAPAPAHSGVIRHERGRAAPGTSFITSAHAPEAILADLDGNVLHRWHLDFLAAFPDYPRQWLDEDSARFWRRAHLFENGDVLAIVDGFGLIKVDRDSKLVWANGVRAHHDLEVSPKGEIYVLVRRGQVLPRFDPERPVLEDSIVVLGPDGAVRRSVSLLAALERSPFRGIWQPDLEALGGDLFHTNSLFVLDGRLEGRLPAFRRGNVLVSMLVPDLLAVVDLDREEVVWAHRGSFRDQHDAQVVANGRLLLFDNRGAEPHSRVLELDPARPDAASWEYAGSAAQPFYSATCGTAQRLPNGNTLITESDAGRAFEVTPGGEIVWEFSSPWRAGDAGELVATLFEVVRLPPEFDTSWARPPVAESAR